MSLPLVYKSGDCFINAFINKRHAYKDKNLKMVFGSTAFNGFFEYGGKTWGLKEFLARHTPGTTVWDAHAWLEDEDGNVYDKFFSFYNFASKVQTGKATEVPNDTVFEGISKAEAKAMGVEYVPADKETQTVIFIDLLKHMMKIEGMLLNGQLNPKTYENPIVGNLFKMVMGM